MSSSHSCQCKFSRVIISAPIWTSYRIMHENCIPNGFKILKVPFYNFCSAWWISFILKNVIKLFYSSKCLILWVVAGSSEGQSRSWKRNSAISTSKETGRYLGKSYTNFPSFWIFLSTLFPHSGYFFPPFVYIYTYIYIYIYVYVYIYIMAYYSAI